MKKEVNKKSPFGVKLVSVFFFLVAVSLGLSSYRRYQIIGSYLTDAVIGLVFIISGVFLWRLKNWARISALILSAIGGLFLFSVAGFSPYVLFFIFISVVFVTIFFYLFLDKSVKE